MIADTSRAAFRDVCETIDRRQGLVIVGLAEYYAEYGGWPTSYELLRFLQRTCPSLDLNGVRPRLTELDTTGRVVKADKRRCAVTEKRVYTWAVVSPTSAEWSLTSPYVEAMTAPSMPPRQAELFR